MNNNGLNSIPLDWMPIASIDTKAVIPGAHKCLISTIGGCVHLVYMSLSENFAYDDGNAITIVGDVDSINYAGFEHSKSIINKYYFVFYRKHYITDTDFCGTEIEIYDDIESVCVLPNNAVIEDLTSGFDNAYFD